MIHEESITIHRTNLNCVFHVEDASPVVGLVDLLRCAKRVVCERVEDFMLFPIRKNHVLFCFCDVVALFTTMTHHQGVMEDGANTLTRHSTNRYNQ